MDQCPIIGNNLARAPTLIFRIFRWAFLVWVLTGSGIVLAQGAGEPDPEKANERGKALYKQQKYADAIIVWEAAFFQASGDIELKLAKNLAVGYKRLDDLGRIFYFLSYRKDVGSPGTVSEKELATLSVLAEALSPGKVLVQITSEPAGAIIYLGETSEGLRFKAPAVWFVKPGEHQITLDRNGRETVTEFTASWGETAKVHLNVARLTALADLVMDDETKPPGNEAGVQLDETGSAEPGSNNQAVAWAVMGGGLAVAVVGGVLDLVAYSKEKDAYETYLPADPNSYNAIREGEVRSLNIAGVVLMVVGGAAGVGGLIWGLVERNKTKKATHAFYPSFSPAGDVGVGFVMTF